MVQDRGGTDATWMAGCRVPGALRLGKAEKKVLTLRHSLGIAHRYKECRQWHARSKFRSETVGRSPCRLGEPQGCLWRWRVAHRQELRRQPTHRPNAPHCLPQSRSVRKNFPTSACRNSSSTIGKPPRHPGSAFSTPKGAAADAAEAPADAAEAPADAAEDVPRAVAPADAAEDVPRADAGAA